MHSARRFDTIFERGLNMGCYKLRSYLILALALVAPLLLTCMSSHELDHPNVILIVIDALRPDHLGCYGYGRPTSPNIDSLARESIVFDNAVAAAPWTKTSFSSFLTGLYPFQHGVVDWEAVMPESIVTLAEMLQASGYRTMAIVNMLGITGRFKVLSGFDQVSEAAKYKRDAEKTTSDAIDMINAATEPFFLMIHYFDTHWPYRPPVKYIDLVTGGASHVLVVKQQARRSDFHKPPDEVVEKDVAYYDACIRFVDHELSRLLDYLDKAGLRENSVIIITADHGEAFWEHGFGSHGHSVYDEEIRVPLIFSNPVEFPKGRRIEDQVSLVDLTPTIAALTHLDDKHHREGRNLVRLVEGKRDAVPPDRLLPPEYDLSESTLKKSPDSKGIRSLGWKIMIEPSTGIIRLYNLKDDPAETVNLWGRESEMGDSLLALLQRVPGISVGGWRLGFTGTKKDNFAARVRVDGGRLRQVERFVAGEGTSIEICPDSTCFKVEVKPKTQQIVLFDVEPQGASVNFEVTGDGPIYVGRDGKQTAKSFTLASREAIGLPRNFDSSRQSATPSAYIWWLPGKKYLQGKAATKLTPEEIKRLKALGYIQ